MIVVKLELWPGGDESRKRDLGKAASSACGATCTEERLAPKEAAMATERRVGDELVWDRPVLVRVRIERESSVPREGEPVCIRGLSEEECAESGGCTYQGQEEAFSRCPAWLAEVRQRLRRRAEREGQA